MSHVVGSRMPRFWLVSEGKDPTRIGFGLWAEIEATCPGFAWILPPKLVESEQYLGQFCAPDLAHARAVALLVATLGDTVTRVWLDQEPATIQVVQPETLAPKMQTAGSP
jgi:hypothetical protein